MKAGRKDCGARQKNGNALQRSAVPFSSRPEFNGLNMLFSRHQLKPASAPPSGGQCQFRAVEKPDPAPDSTATHSLWVLPRCPTAGLRYGLPVMFPVVRTADPALRPPGLIAMPQPLAKYVGPRQSRNWPVNQPAIRSQPADNAQSTTHFQRQPDHVRLDWMALSCYHRSTSGRC